jgi:hypothetical protein
LLVVCHSPMQSVLLPCAVLLLLLYCRKSRFRCWPRVAYCDPNQFQCGDGTCLPSSVVCNGYADCSDALDELNCGTFIHIPPALIRLPLPEIHAQNLIFLRFRSFEPLLPVSTIDYRCEDREKVGEWRDEIGAIRKVLTFSFRTLITTPKKQTVQPEDAIEDTTFKPGFEIVKV